MNDLLNNWEYCNPSNQFDQLPEPYRFINNIIQQDVLIEVYNKVFLIEKYRTDPNYEGQLRTLPPQGIFEISNVTAISKEENNSLIIVGDQQGCLHILDLSRKQRICKKEIGQKKIIAISLGCRDMAVDDYKHHLIISCICHLDPQIYIFRYKPGENIMQQTHSILTTKNLSIIGEFPVQILMSKYSQYISIALYNGTVLIYKIPEIKIEQTNTQQQQTNQNTLLPPIKQQQQQQKQQQQSTQNQNIGNENIITEIIDQQYQIKFQGLIKQQNFNQLIKNLNNQYAPQQEQIENVKEDQKKKPTQNQTLKKQEQTTIKEESKIQENNNSFQIKHVDKDGYDVSEQYPPQQFKAYFNFILEKVQVKMGDKAFDNFKEYDVVTGLIIGWSNTTQVEIHKFAQVKKENLPNYIQSLQQNKSIVLPQITQKNNISRIIQLPILYPIIALTISKNYQQLAIGMKQGSILIYDLIYEQELFYLDKHTSQISHMEYCEDSRLISCSQDGNVHIYNTIDGTILCKRTNQFRKGTKVNYEDQKNGLWRIVSLSVSNYGIGVVQDIEQEVRIYDLWRGDKIAKLTPIQVSDDQQRKWTEKYNLVQCYKNDIIIQSDVIISNQQNMFQQTSLSIFKIFETIVNLFSAISNTYRKGYEKEQIMNLFHRISKSELNNPQFEIPNSITHQNGLSLKVPAHDSKTNKNSKDSLRNSNSQLLHHNSSKSIKKSNISENQIMSKKQSGDSHSSKRQQNQLYEHRPPSLIGSLHKSIHSEKIDYNSSFRSTHSPQHSLIAQSQKIIKASIGLTKEMLHPEEYLLDIKKNSISNLIDENQSMVEHCRLRNSEKITRSQKIERSLGTLGSTLELLDQKYKLQERYRNLKKIK